MKIPKLTHVDNLAIDIRLWDSDLKLINRALDLYAEQHPALDVRVTDIKRMLTPNS